MGHNCEACGGNVLPGKTCYACGLKGPAGETGGPYQTPEWLVHLRAPGQRITRGLHERCRAANATLSTPLPTAMGGGQ